MDSAVETSAGVSAAAERKWGRIGGIAGASVGVGAAAVAIGIDGAPLFEAGLYPSIFQNESVLALDLYMLAVLVAGAAFSAASLVYARRSPYPRTECYGAGLAGLILSLLAGVLLFLRVMALVTP